MSFSKKGGAAFGKTGGATFSKGGGSGPENPLSNVEYTGDLEVDSGAELTELQKAYRQRAANEAERFAEATDPEFWFTVYFKSREEKEKFLKAINAKKNVVGDKYIDGHKLAKMMGVDLSE